MGRGTLILMVGAPGSGKTTAAKKISEKLGNIPVVSSDKVRETLYGNEATQGKSADVFKEVFRLVNENLDKEYICILDATNCEQWARWSAIAHTLPNRVIYIMMEENADILKERNAARDRKVPEKVINRMLRSLKNHYPTEEEAKNLTILNYNEQDIYDIYDSIFLAWGIYV